MVLVNTFNFRMEFSISDHCVDRDCDAFLPLLSWNAIRMSILWQEQVISAFQAISHGILPAKQEPLCCCAENSYLASYTLEVPNKRVWWNKRDARA